MNVTLDKKTIRAIAEEIVKIMRSKDTELITTEEAAKILGVTPSWLRKIKGKYPHVKKGDNDRGRLLFDKKAIIESL